MKLKDLLFVNSSTHYGRIKRKEDIEFEEIDEAGVPGEIKDALGIEYDNKRPKT